MKSEALFRAFGRFLNTLQGRCIIGEDVGTNEFDLVQMSKETDYVLGLPKAYGGSGDTGDMTALGVMTAIRAALAYRFGSSSLKGRSLAIQGLGKVGYHLAQRASHEGAHVIAADMNPHVVGKVAAELNIEAADPWAILDTACDVLCPCALGNVINSDTATKLSCQIIAGSANNQLENLEVAQTLQAQGILYAPDFIVNAGGLIQVASEFGGYDEDRVRHQVDNIYELLLSVFQRSEEQRRSTVDIAMTIVRERMETLQSIHRIYSQGGPASRS
jgi:leucine dehydrogenase